MRLRSLPSTTPPRGRRSAPADSPRPRAPGRCRRVRAAGVQRQHRALPGIASDRPATDRPPGCRIADAGSRAPSATSTRCDPAKPGVRAFGMGPGDGVDDGRTTDLQDHPHRAGAFGDLRAVSVLQGARPGSRPSPSLQPPPSGRPWRRVECVVKIVLILDLRQPTML